ncbi:MAG: glycine cleavage T C-terminal barrel domain-containing protein [Actinomycetota bacterium]
MSLTISQLRSETGAIAGLRDAIIAEGPETETFLQGQLSQDIVSMAPGDSRFSLLLQPQGKVSAWLRVTRLDDERFLLDVDAGWADEVVTRLERFKLRTKCELTPQAWTSLTVVGPDAMGTTIDGAEVEVHDLIAGVPVVVAFGEAPVAAVPEIQADAMNVLRIEDGRPAMGSELDENTIPAAAGIVETSVSFTKGCYTGQELVARIDSRGNNVPRRLVGLVFDGGSPVPGAELAKGDDGVGAVTSVGRSAALDAEVALAYATRAVEIGDSVTVDGATATVQSLPLVQS